MIRRTARLGRVVPALLLALPLGCRDVPDAGSTVTFWAMGREGEVVGQLLPEFERRHPDIRVRVQQIPWSAAHEKLLTAYAGGALPDVFQAGNTWLPELVALRAVDPLDGRIASSATVRRDDYFPGILDTNVVDGRTYGVPWYVDTRLLFYRTDVLADAGWGAPPRTWDGWVDAMTRTTARSASPGYGILLPLGEWQVPVILGLQRGATLLRDGDRYGDFRSAPFRAAFEFYVGLFRRGLAPRTGDVLGNVYQDFARGDFWVYVTGPWNLAEFATRLPRELAGRWATAPLPDVAGDGPGVSLAGGASLSLAATSRRKDAAWRLVEYLSEPARQVDFHRLSGDLPARRRAWIDGGLRRDRRARAFWVQLQHVRSTPKIPEWERIASKIAQYADAAIRGQVPVDTALARLDEEVDAVLEKRRWLLGGGD